MHMNTEELVSESLRFSTLQSEARILFVVENHQRINLIFDSVLHKIQGVKTNSQQCKLTFENGSTIVVIAKDNLQEYLYGAQLTHAFLDVDSCEQDLYSFVRSRIRSAVKHFGMGVYDRYGKYVYY